MLSFKTIRWCARKDGEFSFTGLVQTPIHSKASPSGCQYTRSSVITYNLTMSFCVNQEIPVCVGRGPPYNTSTLAAVSSMCYLCVFFESFDISLTVR